MNLQSKLTIGFIGQGWIGKNYANDFEERSFNVLRYSLDEAYVHNKEKIKDCDVVFVAVPTPTISQKFDGHSVKESLSLIGEGKIAVIKSTLYPGFTKILQDMFPHIFILYNPEFLSVVSAEFDARHPERNIVGVLKGSKSHLEKATLLMSILAKAKYEKICSFEEAEIIKYYRNVVGYARTIFTNIFYDLAISTQADWEVIKQSVAADHDFGDVYLTPVHKNGRGAGGGCFIKDFEAFLQAYKEKVPSDKNAIKILEIMRDKNIELLKGTKKDEKLLSEVYGEYLI